MRKQLSIGAAFAALLAAGAVTAAAVAGKGPSIVQQTVSSSTTTVTTATTATTSTTIATTTTTPAPRKITICHHVFRAKSTKHVTIRINRSAWPAHQRHGDSIGACNTASANSPMDIRSSMTAATMRPTLGAESSRRRHRPPRHRRPGGRENLATRRAIGRDGRDGTS